MYSLGDKVEYLFFYIVQSRGLGPPGGSIGRIHSLKKKALKLKRQLTFPLTSLLSRLFHSVMVILLQPGIPFTITSLGNDKTLLSPFKDSFHRLPTDTVDNPS